MKIGVLTSSRADFGIYMPLLSKLKEDSFFRVEIIAFGTHLSKFHGFTISEIDFEGFSLIHKISSLISNDDEQSIATSYGLTALKFAEFWAHNNYDLVFCLGDRFEMSAAVQAAIPYGVKIAHLHGGETTLGAIDNIYRHQITLASKLHFTATEKFSQRVLEIIGENNNNIIVNVGSLSIDSIEDFVPICKNEFYDKFNIAQEDFALVTFHPETVAKEKNERFAFEMKKALSKISMKLFLVISMPNADTMGSVFRNQLNQLKSEFPDKVLIVENFGKENYFSAMYYSKILIGNSSSGIIEAASFGKYVINVGERQKDRAQSENILDSTFDENDIIKSTNIALGMGIYKGSNIYSKKNSVNLVIESIKTDFEIQHRPLEIK
jgi:GDP/UDP-N,N'-diacetylbacillosamine 2-epimerase (hydrolysing)